jgi:hypothetical protein
MDTWIQKAASGNGGSAQALSVEQSSDSGYQQAQDCQYEHDNQRPDTRNGPISDDKAKNKQENHRNEYDGARNEVDLPVNDALDTEQQHPEQTEPKNNRSGPNGDGN